MPVRIVNWNVAWRRPTGRAGGELRARIDAVEPDIVCLTEGHLDFLSDDGFVLAADADYGYPIHESRRKVLVWSRSPWSDVDTLGTPGLPGGRFVRGTTRTPIGPLTVVGVCIPWSHAHVSTGRRDRAPWQDHRAYLSGLAEVLSALSDQPAIVVGDYNQTIPRTRAPRHVHDALSEVMNSGLHVATAGPIRGVDALTIDHLAHTRHLRALDVESLSNVGPEGRQLSDHFGLLVDLDVT